MNDQTFNKKAIAASTFRSNPAVSHASLLSRCAPWVILMATGLWLAGTSAVIAMEPSDNDKKSNSEIPVKSKSKKSHHTEEPQITDYLITQEFCRQGTHLSRLNELRNILYGTKKLNKGTLEECKKILKCPHNDRSLFQVVSNIPPLFPAFSDIRCTDLIITLEDLKNRSNGFSGAIVSKPLIRNNTKIIIKKFNNIKIGLKDLLGSLAALDVNPSPAELKMARIYDAVFCSDCSEGCLSIIMECAGGIDIGQALSTSLPENAIIACAKYLSKFHSKSYNKNKINGMEFLYHASKPFHTLVHNLLREDNGNIPLFSLVTTRELPDLEEIDSGSALHLLTETEQNKFIQAAKRNSNIFYKNAIKIYDLLNNDYEKEKEFYFLTVTHGDANGNNFFYNDYKFDEWENISPRSSDRITMIDFSSIVNTFGNIGDPAEDVGRLLGYLWLCAAQQYDSEEEMYQKASGWEEKFVEAYINEIKISNILIPQKQEDFQNIFKENYNFYKLRFYRAILNRRIFNLGYIDDDPQKTQGWVDTSVKREGITEVEKDCSKPSDFRRRSINKEIEIKKNLLKSWIKENSDLAQPLQLRRSVAEESPLRHWIPVQGKPQHNLPDPVEEFITSIGKGDSETYLTKLWKMLNKTGQGTLSSKAVIAGMGGIGKTTLALEYANEAKENNAYNLIYWLQSGSEDLLLQGYRKLLQEMDVFIGNATNEGIISLFKEHVPQKGRCLLIYDNVFNAGFLEGKLPNNTHILITSRSQDWEHPLLLGVFRPEDSVRYLLNVTGLEPTNENGDLAEKLAEELGHFPLALAHAAHYIKLLGGKKASKDHFVVYLKDFRNFEKNRNFFTEAQSNLTYENLIRKTFRIAERKLPKPVKNLLKYCAYLHSEFIPKDIFFKFMPESNVNKAFDELCLFSFIKPTQEFFSIHNLLQLVIRKRQEQKRRTSKLIEKLIPSLQEKIVEIIKIEDINKINNKLFIYLPHTVKILDHAKDLEMNSCEVHQVNWLIRMLDVSRILRRNKEEDELRKKFTPSWKTVYSEKPKGVDDQQSLKWLLEVCESAHPTIQCTIGSFYSVGYLGGNIDNRAALKWYKKAAEKNNVDAQFNIGFTYNTGGYGIEINEKKAFKWFKKASDQNYQDAYHHMGIMYLYGRSVEKNYKEALGWFYLAWFCNANEQEGSGETPFCIAGIYHEGGYGVEKNQKECLHWLHTVAAQNNAKAQYFIGYLYDEEKDYKEALIWYEKAAAQNYGDALFRIGLMHLAGNLGEKKEDLALEFIHKAAALGSENAQLWIKIFEYVRFSEKKFEQNIKKPT